MREAKRVAESDVRTAEQQVRREKRQMQQARERAARRSSTAARNGKDAGLPKIIAGAIKRRAQESAGRIDGVNAARVDDARTRLDDAERALRDDPLIVLDLPDTEVPAGRDVFTGNGLRISRCGRLLFGRRNRHAIRGPERIALTGPNGVGKSTLLRIISGDLDADAGTVGRSDGRMAYLSQAARPARPRPHRSREPCRLCAESYVPRTDAPVGPIPLSGCGCSPTRRCTLRR